MKNYRYQVGGSLKVTDPSYVEREADSELYESLIRGEFCYVFNSRQMGKSSLRVRIKHRLQQEEFCCAAIDITSIGSENTTAEQWYKGIASELWRGFNLLGIVNFKSWWGEQEGISPVQRLSRFIEEVILAEIESQKIFIFVDEIDSILSLNFSIDDFFAVIRYCYNQRAENPIYNRLTFALFGVATPSNLIQDRNRTPFNIGKAIELHGFQFREAQPLAKGLEGKIKNPKAVLNIILDWTGGQPFLTQKLCKLVLEYAERGEWERPEVEKLSSVLNPPSTPSFPETTSKPSKSTQQIFRKAKIAAIVQKNILENWESQDEPEHLKTIRNRLLMNEQRAGRLLGLYQKILQQGSILADDSGEQIDLLLSGLVVKQQGKLRVYNRIYEAVFNQVWIDKELAKRRPYSEAICAWIESNSQDESRLLRGNALEDAQDWARGKSLSDIDYRFLAASQESEKKQVQNALNTAQKANQILSEAQQKAKRTIQRGLVGLGSISILAVALLGLAAFLAFQATQQKRQAIENQISALTLSSEALFKANQNFEALLESLKAANSLRKNPWANNNIDLKTHVKTNLQQTLDWVREKNRLEGHEDSVMSVSFSPDNQQIASGGRDGTIKLWGRNGELLHTLRGHQDSVWSVNYSFDGQTLISASRDETAKLWSRDGKLLKTLRGHQAWVVDAVFCPNSREIATASWDGTVKLWTLEGELIKTLTGHTGGVFDISFSPDNSVFATAGRDGTVKLWTPDGRLIRTLKGHQDWVFTVSFSRDGKTLASGSRNGEVKLWSREGELLKTFSAHQAAIFRVRFTPDSQTLATASWDTTVKLWNLDGEELPIQFKHNDAVWGLSLSEDGILATGGEDRTVKLWQIESNRVQILRSDDTAVRSVELSQDDKILATASMDMTVKLWSRMGRRLRTLRNFDSTVRSVSFSPDGSMLATATWGKTVKLWSIDGEELRQFEGHQAAVWDVVFSPKGDKIASVGEDKTVKIWSIEGELIKTLTGHQAGVFTVSFSPNSQFLVSGSEDKTVKLWTVNGELLQTFSGHSDWVIGVNFSPDSQEVISVSQDGMVKRWNLAGEELSSFQTFDGLITGVGFSADGEKIALAYRDGMVKLWSLRGERLQILRGHMSAVRDVNFSHDGQTLVSSDASGQVIFWNLKVDLTVEELIAQGCDWVGDYLQTNPNVSVRDFEFCEEY
ncbi:AAA-like domain-containing protein [Capilliphycus salinus ALCB114379]|uniref:AAA-like domain-containing protein n=1 Tax=Capilliphycus salinus TaxID=2768948 RepID=UPI0039A74AFD